MPRDDRRAPAASKLEWSHYKGAHMTNTGTRTIDWLFETQLQVDEEWSTRTPNGFKWWADKHAQTIEVIGEVSGGPGGQVGYLVSVRTELLRSVQLSDAALKTINLFFMPTASMAGPVYDQSTQTLSLASLVRVHEDISGWMNPLLSVAATLQLHEAGTIGVSLATALHAEEALSSPPGRGIRPKPDEMALVAGRVFLPLGRHPSRWSPAEFQEAVAEHMDRPPAMMASAGGAGLTVEFPFGDQSSLCQMMAEQPHPQYGNGLLMLQSFPTTAKSDVEGVKLALAMNQIELAKTPFGYGFGSYAYRDDMLRFNSFFPNALYRNGLLPSLYFSCAERAREMSVRQTGTDWTKESFSPRKTAIGQMIDRYLEE